MSDNSKIVVLDNGSGLCKIGFAGDAAPEKVFPSVVGCPKSNQSNGERCVGDAALAKVSDVILKYPIEHGTIKHWDDMEKVWHHAFFDTLIDPSEHPLLITDHHNELAINKTQREKIIQIMFETFSVPSFRIESSTKLALYSSGRTAGVVIDCGDGVTDISCCNAGEIPTSIRGMRIGGRDITKYLEKCLTKQGRTVSATQSVHDMKEKLAYVALDFAEEMKKAKETRQGNANYTGTSISSERFQCAELLFNPRLDGFSFDGVHQILYNSVMECPRDLRQKMFENIVVSGGTSRLPGFTARLKKEITGLVPDGMKVKIFAAPDRRHGVWLGGSIVASLSNSPKTVVSRREYTENGPVIVHRKCH